MIIVCITDGRANIPLELSTENKFAPSTDPESKDGMPSRKFLKDEVSTALDNNHSSANIFGLNSHSANFN